MNERRKALASARLDINVARRARRTAARRSIATGGGSGRRLIKENDSLSSERIKPAAGRANGRWRWDVAQRQPRYLGVAVDQRDNNGDNGRRVMAVSK